jgi:uncharacterized RDD family membrane protein YckC
MNYPASRTRRFFANLLDGIIVGLSSALIYFIYYLITGKYISVSSYSSIYDVKFTKLYAIYLLIDLILIFIFFTLIPNYVWKGQTIMKKLFGIAVVKEDDSEVDLSTLLLRNLIWFINVPPIPVIKYFIQLVVLIDALLIFGEDKRTLHDRIAKTKVIEV